MYKTNNDKIFLDEDVHTNSSKVRNEESDADNVSAEIAQMVIEIAQDKNTSSERLLEIYYRLYELYSNGNRHSYSVISASIQQNMKKETTFIIRLQDNMEAFLQLVQRNLKNDEDNKNVEASFNKLYDHVMLECNRMCYIAKISKDLKMQQDIVKDQVNSAVMDIKKLYADLIGIVSIFVAIFALITVNANIAFKLTTTNMNKIFLGIIVMNVFVVACIIALLYAVRKLIIDKLTEIR
ncbi:hypothetical protein [Anaerostipes faecalis]|uniref:hypothetical protein n=1 Tax=Anaerostipes faecalis TaxID=2738446 RepID=UPI001C1E6A67|nr:hypothetical protein [Anaerostipes faecalis]